MRGDRLRPPTVPLYEKGQSVYGGVGRPTGYTIGMAEYLCHRLSCGETMKRICSEDGMPSQSMVYRWLNTYPKFREKYQIAREIQADTLADETLDIAREGSVEDVAKNRLRLDAVRWFTKILNPSKYGDHQTVKHEGEIDLNVTLRAKPDDDLNREIEALLTRGNITDVEDESDDAGASGS